MHSKERNVPKIEHIYIYTYICMCIYIYREREREPESFLVTLNPKSDQNPVSKRLQLD